MEDASAMADTLVHMVQNTTLRHTLAHNARAHALARCSATAMWQGYWSFLQDLSQKP
jgi:hypothetical protein